jgi:hypothetical protein
VWVAGCRARPAQQNYSPVTVVCHSAERLKPPSTKEPQWAAIVAAPVEVSQNYFDTYKKMKISETCYGLLQSKLRAYSLGGVPLDYIWIYIYYVYMPAGRLYLLVGDKKHHSTKDKVLDVVNTKICNNQLIMLISGHRVVLYV